jgi:hypothetical protein
VPLPLILPCNPDIIVFPFGDCKAPRIRFVGWLISWWDWPAHMCVICLESPQSCQSTLLSLCNPPPISIPPSLDVPESTPPCLEPSVRLMSCGRGAVGLMCFPCRGTSLSPFLGYSVSLTVYYCINSYMLMQGKNEVRTEKN